MNAAGGRKRALVEVGVRYRYPAGQMTVDDLVDVAECRLANDVIAADAVDASVEGRELVARINEGFIGVHLLSVPEADDADLADAADARTGGLDINDDEVDARFCGHSAFGF